mgnify:CR=1 FL=1
MSNQEHFDNEKPQKEALTSTSSSTKKHDSRVIYIYEPASQDNPEEVEQFISSLGYFHISAKLISSKELLIATAIRIPPACILLGDGVSQIDAQEIIETIKRSCSNDIPVLFAQKPDSPEQRMMVARLGADGFYAKPVNLPKMVDHIDKLYTTRSSIIAYRALLVDSDTGQAKEHASILKRNGFDVDIVKAPEQVLEALKHLQADVVITESDHENFTGMEVAAMLRQHDLYSWMPVVVLANYVTAQMRLDAIRVSNVDIMPKPIGAKHLVDVATSEVHKSRMIRSTMMNDSLTGLYNHTAIKRMLDSEVAQARRTELPICFAMIDIDHFKRVNDTHGHPTGDKVISTLAALLKRSLRKADIVGRYGGEEFSLILPDTSLDEATLVIDKIRQNFEKVVHTSFEGETFLCTLSAGVYEMKGEKSSEDMISEADAALYKAKQAGRNTVKTTNTKK